MPLASAWAWNFPKALLNRTLLSAKRAITGHVSCAADNQTGHSFDILSKAANK
jgi:hypothetical protein